eukprot:15158708-Alexandrium_andersonii.AAC.1
MAGDGLAARPEEAALEVVPAPWLGALTAAAGRDLVVVPLHGAPGLRGDVHLLEVARRIARLADLLEDG